LTYVIPKVSELLIDTDKNWNAKKITNVDIEVINASSLPSAGNKGRIVFNTNDNKLYYDNGSSWVAFS